MFRKKKDTIFSAELGEKNRKKTGGNIQKKEGKEKQRKKK